MTTDEQVRERVRRVLGAIGDAALPATAFDEIDPAGTEPWAAESTFRRRAAVTVALAQLPGSAKACADVAAAPGAMRLSLARSTPR